MSKYRRYARYKDSGVEWIGEIPEEWKVVRLKFLKTKPFAYGANESADLEEPELPRFIRITDIDSNGNLRGDTFKSLPWQIAKPYLLKEGDILFARSGATVGKTFIYKRSWGAACFAGYLIKFEANTNKVIPKYIYYYTLSWQYENWIKQSTIQATIQNVSAEKYSNLFVPLPLMQHQKMIVHYLDQKTAEIDGLIADKEKLIELLQEKRQAIISEAVTKGLNQNVRMKDSGVEWIGEIPEHWEVTPLKYVTNFISRGNSPEYVEESSIKVINQACIYWDELKIENVKYQNEDIDFSKLKGKLVAGDLLLNSTGIGTLGRAVVFREDGDYMADSHVTIVRFNKMKMNEILAFYILQTKIYQGFIYNTLVTGATNQIELSRERLTTTPMIVPPIAEQREIVNFLDVKIRQISILVNEIKLQIQKLKEYRQSLISEAVTGKIDVRNYAVG